MTEDQKNNSKYYQAGRNAGIRYAANLFLSDEIKPEDDLALATMEDAEQAYIEWNTGFEEGLLEKDTIKALVEANSANNKAVPPPYYQSLYDIY